MDDVTGGSPWGDWFRQVSADLLRLKAQSEYVAPYELERERLRLAGLNAGNVNLGGAIVPLVIVLALGVGAFVLLKNA